MQYSNDMLSYYIASYCTCLSPHGWGCSVVEWLRGHVSCVSLSTSLSMKGKNGHEILFSKSRNGCIVVNWSLFEAGMKEHKLPHSFFSIKDMNYYIIKRKFICLAAVCRRIKKPDGCRYKGSVSVLRCTRRFWVKIMFANQSAGPWVWKYNHEWREKIRNTRHTS